MKKDLFVVECVMITLMHWENAERQRISLCGQLCLIKTLNKPHPFFYFLFLFFGQLGDINAVCDSVWRCPRLVRLKGNHSKKVSTNISKYFANKLDAGILCGGLVVVLCPQQVLGRVVRYSIIRRIGHEQVCLMQRGYTVHNMQQEQYVHAWIFSVWIKRGCQRAQVTAFGHHGFST
jgi:hypothetical protein